MSYEQLALDFSGSDSQPPAEPVSDDERAPVPAPQTALQDVSTKEH